MQNQTKAESSSEDLLSSSEDEVEEVQLGNEKDERIDDGETNDKSRIEAAQPEKKKKAAKLKAKKTCQAPKKKKKVKLDVFEDEAQEASSDEGSADEGQSTEDVNDRLKAQALKLPPKRANWLSQFEGKNEQEVNQLFEKRRYRQAQSFSLYPEEGDPQIYTVKIKNNHPTEVCLDIFKKFVGKRLKNGTKSPIVSVFYLKKKYSHYLFVEGYSKDQIYHCLKGIEGVKLFTLSPIQGEEYSKILVRPKKQTCDIEKGNFVRVCLGLYENDLARIVKVGKGKVQVELVPRLQLDIAKVKEQFKTSSSQPVISAIRHIHYLAKVNSEQRPPKNLVHGSQLQQLLRPTHHINQRGMVVLNYRLDEITKIVGAVTPKQISYFKEQANIQEFLQQQRTNFAVKPVLRQGQLVKCIKGEAANLVGRIKKIDDEMVTFDGHAKGKFVAQLTEHITYICPVFKKGEAVMVASGIDAGKEGVVVKISGRETTILTKNDNQLTVLTKLLKPKIDGIGLQPSTFPMRKYDLIRTAQSVGIVLSWDSTTVKILSQQGRIECLSVLQIDELGKKENSLQHFALNCLGEKIRIGSIVRIQSGNNNGKICEVKRLHQSTAFLFNKDFAADGIVAINVDEIRLMTTGKPLGNVCLTKQEKQYERKLIGMVVTIQSGFYKGQQGTVQRVANQLAMIKLNSTRKVVDVSLTCVPKLQMMVEEMNEQARMARRARPTSQPFEQSKICADFTTRKANLDSSSEDEDSN